MQFRSIIILLEFQDVSGLGIDVVFILQAALVKLDLIDLSAVLPIQFNSLDIIGFRQAGIRKRLCKSFTLGERSDGYIFENFVIQLVCFFHCFFLLLILLL